MRLGAARATLLKDAGEVTALFPPRGRQEIRRTWPVADLVQQAPPLPAPDAAAGAGAVVAATESAPVLPPLADALLALDYGDGLALTGGGPNANLTKLEEQGECAPRADAIAKRAMSLLQARSPRGSEEKSQVIELPASGDDIVSQAEITLTELDHA